LDVAATGRTQDRQPVNARLDPADFRLPATHVVRGHALHLLAEVDQAVDRLVAEDGDHAEAVHDYRVALRRLRAWLKSYGECMGVSRKAVRRLGKRASASSPVRDGEVTLALMQHYAEALASVPRAILRRYLDSKAAELAEDRRTLIRKVPRGWARERERLLLELLSGTHTPSTTPFIELLEATISAAAAQLDRSMREQATASEMHATRIDVKSLRYLLEPLQGTHLGAGSVLTRLRALQDTYGAFSDHDVLLLRLRSAMVEVAEQQAEAMYELSTRDHYDAVAHAALRRADPVPPLAAIARMTSARHRELFDELLTRPVDQSDFESVVSALFEHPALSVIEGRAS
jgi:CHAD domain-containing protein